MAKDAISIESLEAEVEIRKEAETLALVDLADYMRERAVVLPPGSLLTLTLVEHANQIEGCCEASAIGRSCVRLAADALVDEVGSEGDESSDA